MSYSEAHIARKIRRADPKTIHDKFLVGYQGWFTAAGDGDPVGPGHHGWLHWVNKPLEDGGRINTDLWPDLSQYSPSELFRLPGLNLSNGDPVFLFSSRHPKTVQRHFHWMAEHGVDGAFLQRFLGQCDRRGDNEGILRIRDEVGDRVREAAEKEGRVFAIMYDVSGMNPDDMRRVLERDWIHLIRDKCILDSPSYLREKGKPVVSLWGFGMAGNNHNPHVIRAMIHFIRDNTPGGAYIIGGSPAHWRSSEGDADPDPEFLKMWLNEFDAISPWTIGRYGNEEDADRFAEEKIKGDTELLRKRNAEGHRHVDYMPVVFPGGSGFNLSEGKWGFNDIKRDGGRFLWRQVFNAKRLGVRMIYGAMWDEYDEGTAFMPVVSHRSQLPTTDRWPLLALDEDGYNLPSDWYMRICGFAAEGLRSERRIHEAFPSKELDDYWASRPKYEEPEQKETGPSGAHTAGQDYQSWLASQKDDKDEPPPPPYSMEAAQANAVASGSAPQPALQTRPAEALLSPPIVEATSRPALVPATVGGMAALTNNFEHQSSISSPPLGSPVSPSLPPDGNRPPVRLSSQSAHVIPPFASGPSRPYTGGPPEPSVPQPGGQWPPSDWTQSPQVRPLYGPPPHPGPRPSAPSTPSSPAFVYPQPPHQNYPTQPGHPYQGYPQGPSFPARPGESSSQAPRPNQAYPQGTSLAPAQNALHPNIPPPLPQSRPSYAPPAKPPTSAPGGSFLSSMAPTGAPPSGSGIRPLEFAIQAVDSFAGEERRRQLERGVGSLAETGSKLLGRFTRR